LASKKQVRTRVEDDTNNKNTNREVIITNQIRTVISQVFLHGVIDVVIIFFKDHVVQLLYYGGGVKALGVTLQTRFIICAQHTFWIVNLSAKCAGDLHLRSISNLKIRALRSIYSCPDAPG